MEDIYIESEEIIIDFSKFSNFDEIVELMFWKDLYFQSTDTINIHNVNTDEYFEIERKFHYCDFNQLVEDGEKIRFDRILDSDIIEDIKYEYED